MTEKVNVIDVPIDCLRMTEVVDRVEHALRNGEQLRLGVVNAAKMVNMRRNPALDSDVRASDLILADGMSVVWASRFSAKALPERVAGIDLMHAMMDRGSQSGRSVFLLGAKEEVCTKVKTLAEQDYPGIKIVGYRNGYFDEAEEASIVEEINALAPDMMFVAITSPKKERFMARWSSKLRVGVVHGVGGSFDVYAGVVERAPAWMQKSGLEWLYRVIQEPRRMWRRYLVTNVKFVWLVLSDAFRSRES